MRWHIALLLGLTWWSLASCSPNVDRSVAGILVDVQASEIVHADALSLRDNDGKIWDFRVSRAVASNTEDPFSASHLRQHMMLAQPVEVFYRETGSGLEALRIRDAES